MTRHDRYREFEKWMTAAVLADAVLFVLFLMAGGWFKTLLTVLIFAVGGVGLLMLGLRQELLRRRSLWLTCGFFAVTVCTAVSLILCYP